MSDNSKGMVHPANSQCFSSLGIRPVSSIMHTVPARIAKPSSAGNIRAMKPFFVTFGQGSPFKNRFIGIMAPEQVAAQAAMTCAFAERWSYCYPVFRGIQNALEVHIREYRLQPLCHLQIDAVGNVNIITEQKYMGALLSEQSKIYGERHALRPYDTRLAANEIRGADAFGSAYRGLEPCPVDAG